ncbi:site-2 protease family protein [candidate division WOR-3 bacterium]|nr:site-2 protease family protein [candidate division WOR-3 bacterium]
MIEEIISQYMEIEEQLTPQSFLVTPRTDKAFSLLKKDLSSYNLLPMLTKRDDGKVLLHLHNWTPPSKGNNYINLVLFIATLFTTLWVGGMLARGQDFSFPGGLIYGIPFSFTLLLILGSHEFGHYFACKRLGIDATLPYFIPLPPPSPLGTFGALIRIKSPIEDRNALVEVGAMGPLSGLVVAIPAMAIGLLLSQVIPIEQIEKEGVMRLGNSILSSILTMIFVKEPYEGAILFHPVAWAAWIGMFITAVNLLPVGQLDGGHISFALFGKRHRTIGWVTIGILVLLGFTFWPGFAVWAVLVAILGTHHPPPLNTVRTLDRKQRLLGILSILVFLLTFILKPFSF